MAMIYATITGTITRPGSNVGVRARITATPLTTNQALTFTGDDRITIGPETAETNGSGTLSTLKIPTNVDVGALLWRITAEALDRGPGPSRWTVKNAVAITGSSTIKLKDLVEVDVITVDAAIVTNVSALVADADSSKTAAAGSATAAAGSASAAATSASAAAGSATGASGSASAAATSASTASTKAGEASGSATAAAGSASAAAASASHADAMAGAAEAVAVSNDTIIAGRINDSASATAAALTASTAQGIAGAAYTPGMTPADAVGVKLKPLDKDAKAGRLFEVQKMLAQRDVTPVNIVILGDSIVEGVGASAPGYRWPIRFGNRLRALYPTPGVTGGDGYVTAYAASTTGYALDSASQAGNVIQSVDAWGLAQRSLQLGPDTGSGRGMILFGGYHVCTSFDLHFRSMGADSAIEVSTDNGATYAAVPTGAAGERVYRVTLGARGTPVIRVRYVSGSATCVHGVMFLDGNETKGIRVYPGGKSGSRAEQFWDASNGQHTYWNLALNAINPSLVIIEWLTNDMTQKTPAQYKDDIQHIINLVRANTTVPVVLAPPWKRPNSATIGLAPWDDYMAVLAQVEAANLRTVLLDVNTRKPTDADTLGVLADGLHPNDTGHGVLADHYARELLAF